MKANKVSADLNYITVSQSLLYAVRCQDDTAARYWALLKNATENSLKIQLPDDANRKAFWLNVYNASVQWLLNTNLARYKNRNAFFSDRKIIIAGRLLSLDDIEHGILRHSSIKWSLGYLNKVFTSTFEKISG